MTTLQVSSLARSVVLGRRSVDAEVTADKIRTFGKRSRGRRIVSGRHTYNNGDAGANAVDTEKSETRFNDRFWLCCLRFASERCI